MTDEDMKTGKKMVRPICSCCEVDDTDGAHYAVAPVQLEEEFVQANPEWVEELQIMQQSREKAEIQALSSFGFQYLSQVYLPLKLQEGDWV